MKITTSSLLIVSLLAFSGAIAHASTLLYSENFDSYSVGAMPSRWTTSGVSTGKWGVSDAASSSSPNSFRGVDGSASEFYLTSYRFTNIPEVASATTMGINFDLRIDNYNVALGNAGTFRVAFRPKNSDAAQYAIGLGFATIDSASHLFFYAGNSSAPTVGASTAIGYTAGEGFAEGFDLGSSVSAGTGGSFYNFAFTFDNVSKAVQIVVTNLADLSETFTFNDTWMAGGVADTTGELILSTGSGSTGTMYVDNVSIHAIPEGQHLAAFGGILLTVFLMIQRRKPAKV